MSATITSPLPHGITLNTGTYGPTLSLTNTAAISAAPGTAGAYLVAAGAGDIGIFTTSPATITNAGFILGGEGGAGGLYAPTLMVGELFLTYFIGAGGAGGMALYTGSALLLTNTGTITGGAGGTGAEDEKPGNGGTGAAAITGGADSTVINTGLIAGGNGGAAGTSTSFWVGQSGTGGDGINLASGLIINAGTISGGYGTFFFASNDTPAFSAVFADALSFTGIGTLAVDPGAAFIGPVAAAPGSTLALAGTGSGIFNMGGSFSGFSDITFAPGAAWTLDGSISELAAGQIISGFGGVDQINLLGLSLASQTYITGTGLILNNAVTLNVTDFADGLMASSHAGYVAINITTDTIGNSSSTGITFAGVLLSIAGTAALEGLGGVAGVSGDITISSRNEFVTEQYGSAGAAAIYATATGINLVNAGTVAGGNGGSGGYIDLIYRNRLIIGVGGLAGPGESGGAAVTDPFSLSVDNTGVILGGTGGNGAHGYAGAIEILYYAAGSGANAGAGGYGLQSTAAMLLVNSGQIAGGAGGIGGVGGAGDAGYNADLNKASAVAGGAGGKGGAGNAAISAGAGSTLYNIGSIEGGAGGAGGAGGSGGIWNTFSSPTGVNGESGYGGAGIILAGGTVINAGFIAGGTGSTQGDAISFTGYGTLIADPGAVFIGEVAANNGAYLYLAAASTGSISLAGVTNINFAPTAAWTLSGSPQEFLNGEITSHFGPQDAIDIAGLTITNDRALNDTLFLFDSGAIAGTLNLPKANIPAGDIFLAYNDGHGGTDIALAAPTTATLTAGTLDSTPTIALAATLTALPGATIASPTIAGGTLNLDSGATLLGTIAFTGTAGRLILDGPPPPTLITGFTEGDTIELAHHLFPSRHRHRRHPRHPHHRRQRHPHHPHHRRRLCGRKLRPQRRPSHRGHLLLPRHPHRHRAGC